MPLASRINLQNTAGGFQTCDTVSRQTQIIKEQTAFFECQRPFHDPLSIPHAPGGQIYLSVFSEDQLFRFWQKDPCFHSIHLNGDVAEVVPGEFRPEVPEFPFQLLEVGVPHLFDGFGADPGPDQEVAVLGQFLPQRRGLAGQASPHVLQSIPCQGERRSNDGPQGSHEGTGLFKCLCEPIHQRSHRGAGQGGCLAGHDGLAQGGVFVARGFFSVQPLDLVQGQAVGRGLGHLSGIEPAFLVRRSFQTAAQDNEGLAEFGVGRDFGVAADLDDGFPRPGQDHLHEAAFRFPAAGPAQKGTGQSQGSGLIDGAIVRARGLGNAHLYDRVGQRVPTRAVHNDLGGFPKLSSLGGPADACHGHAGNTAVKGINPLFCAFPVPFPASDLKVVGADAGAGGLVQGRGRGEHGRGQDLGAGDNGQGHGSHHRSHGHHNVRGLEGPVAPVFAFDLGGLRNDLRPRAGFVQRAVRFVNIGGAGMAVVLDVFAAQQMTPPRSQNGPRE